MRRQALIATVALLAGCGADDPSTPSAADDVAEVSLELGENAAVLEPPLSDADVGALRSGFAWGRTRELTPRDPAGNHALHYAVIAVEGREQLEALDLMRVHWDPLPLFPEETSRYAGRSGVLRPSRDERSLYVFALVPAAVYNEIRRHEAAGEHLFDIVSIRPAPAGARNADGSISYAYLRNAGFAWRGVRTAALAQPHEVATTSRALLGGLIRRVAKAIADATSTVIDGVQQGIGAADSWINGSAKLTVTVDFKHTDPGFGNTSILQAWGARRGQPVSVPGVTVRARQGIALFKGTTDLRNVATFRVTKDRSTALCIEAASDAAEVTEFLLPETLCSFLPAQSYSRDTQISVPVKHRYANVLAQVSDARGYLDKVGGYRPKRATVLVGWLANKLSSGGRAYAPCGSIMNWGTGLLDLVPVVSLASVVVDFFLAVDMVIPDESATSRGVATHEYGHFTLCSMMSDSSLIDFGAAWTEITVQTLWEQRNGTDNRTADSEASVINEAFADFIAGQVVGGANYFDPAVFDQDTSDHTISWSSQHLDYCLPASDGCWDKNHRRWTDFNLAVAATATLLHDAFDGHRSTGNVPGFGAAWNANGTFGGSAPDAYDEVVVLPGSALRQVVDVWSQRATLLHKQSFHKALAEVITARGYYPSQACLLFALHDPDALGRCQRWLGFGSDGDDPVRGRLSHPVDVTGVRATPTSIRFSWRDISVASVSPLRFSYTVKRGTTVVAQGSVAYARSASTPLITVPSSTPVFTIEVRTVTATQTSDPATFRLAAESDGGEDPCRGPAAAHIPACNETGSGPRPQTP